MLRWVRGSLTWIRRFTKWIGDKGGVLTWIRSRLATLASSKCAKRDQEDAYVDKGVCFRG